MDIFLNELCIGVEGEQLNATMLRPSPKLPGILFVHGWGGSQSQDLSRAREVSGLGCVCLTFDLRGHDLDSEKSRTVSRAENIRDLLAAYDWLAAQSIVDPNAIAVIGISYGGYLASILTSLRNVRWLALRAPALYKDPGWELPKRQLHADQDLNTYRHQRISEEENKALKACAAFRGDALIVASEKDDIIPHKVIENYIAAFSNVRSLTSRTISDADHSLSEKHAQKSYTTILIRWLTEMVVGARESSATTQIEQLKNS